VSAHLTLTVPRLRRLDPLGALLVVAGATAVIFLPFVVFKSNRIVPGDPRGLLEVLPAWGAFAGQATLLLAAIAALGMSNARVRLGAALLGVVVRSARRGRRRRCAHARRQQGGARRSRRRFLGAAGVPRPDGH